jgi:hypothetical protein
MKMQFLGSFSCFSPTSSKEETEFDSIDFKIKGPHTGPVMTAPNTLMLCRNYRAALPFNLVHYIFHNCLSLRLEAMVGRHSSLADSGHGVQFGLALYWCYVHGDAYPSTLWLEVIGAGSLHC